MKKLPIGLQTFSEIIENDYIYIDKTDIALNLIKTYKYAFLSRPRRFGKSLFLDTLKNIFQGKKELFKGLYIYDKYDFEEYPVIKISWAGSDYSNSKLLEEKAQEELLTNQEELKIECDKDKNIFSCFRELIRKSAKKYNKKVVILIDEYDKPILNELQNPSQAIKNRDFLRGFYEVLKDNDEYIKFAFLTGISKFSKANIFSGLNMLTDISLVAKYGNICGYTQSNIENEFKEYLKDVDLELFKRYYNGYNFLKDPIYNPFDVLQFIANDYQFKNYWWKSGNPYFLIELLKKQNYNIPEIENIVVGEELLDSFEVEKIQLEVLLFQAGYLTIDKYIQTPFGIQYKLKVPNFEVQISLNALFLNYLTNNNYETKRFEVYKILLNADLENFKELMTSVFASIPYNNYSNNNIANYEGYYASVFYTYLASIGVDIIAEDVTNAGRIDLTIKIDKYIYIIEFKVGNDDALNQIKTKNYHQKYLNENKDIYLVGINFDKEKKNISKFEWEKVI